jgi:class 3 adenylate cyclase/tetratricopeptide (TPR) repeat protein
VTERGWIGPEASAQRIFDAYVPRGVLQHLAREPFHPVRTVEGTMLFADLSGFTQLSEKLQRRGPEGAELLVGTINGVFESLLRVAYDNGGSLIKFGGDALLIFFDGPEHAARAARAAFVMRERLRTVGRLDVSGVRGVLRMTVGLHSDEFHFVLVGESHLEHLVLGAGAKGIVETEARAENGQIVVSAATAAGLTDSRVVRAVPGPDGEVLLLRRSPLDADLDPTEEIPRPPSELVGRALSTAVRAHVLGGRAAPEHRRASVAFLQFRGTNAIIAAEGIDVAAAAVHELVADVQEAADAWEICFLDSDIDADGGKLLLTAGAPRAVGDDEERMLLTLRQIIDGPRRLPIRIGVNRGPVFTGEIGPYYRRSYIVMGDTTNLAARVMGKSRMGAVWATPGILERSTTKFATDKLEPFAAKGKAKLVQAYEVGPPRRATVPAAAGGTPLPLVGRENERAVVDKALAMARDGHGCLVEVLGEAGIGKTRLLRHARSNAGSARLIRVAGEAHTTTVPYVLWHALLRQVLGIAPDAEPAEAVTVLQISAEVAGVAEWLPLLADVLGVDAPPTPEVAALAPEFRRARLQAAVRSLLAVHADDPLLIEIEHAHLIDEASAALLGATVELLPETAWLIVSARRPVPGGFVAPAVPHRYRLDLAPMNDAAALKLAEAATDAAPLPPHVLDAAVARAAGNPQFLLDLLAAAGGDLPDSAQAAAMSQIDALAPADRALVRRAAVLGSSFPASRLAAVAGQDVRPEAWDRLSHLIVLTDGGTARFRRATVREAAYAALPYRERRALHAVVADVLTAESAAGTAVDDGVLAGHHRAAGRPDRAYPLARRAAARAAAQAAPAAAVALYRMALETGGEIGAAPDEITALWEALAEQLRLAGEVRAADAALLEVRRRCAGDPVRLAEIYFRQAKIARNAERTRYSVRLARAGRRVLDGVPGPAAAGWRARLIANEAADRTTTNRHREAIALCAEALAEAERGSGPVAERAVAHASYLLDVALVALGRDDEAVHSARAREIYARLGDLGDLAAVLNNLGTFAYFRGDWEEAVRRYRECGEINARIGDVVDAAFGDCNVGEVLSDQGHWAEAEEALRRAQRVWRAGGFDSGAAFVRMLLGRLAVRTGKHTDGLALLESAISELAGLAHDDVHLARAWYAEGAAYAGRGDDARAAVARVRAEAPGRFDAVLARAEAIARLAQGPGAVVPALCAALAAAEAENSDHDVLLTLDALCHYGARTSGSDATSGETLAAWARRRDEVAARLGVCAYPLLP